MSLCNGCGSCCDPVALDVREFKRKNPKWRAWASAADPRDDRMWDIWRKDGWTDDQRQVSIDHYLDIRFITEHWFSVGDGDSLCAAFDEETRSCTVYEDRPPVCRNFPWYSRPLGEIVSDTSVANQVPWCGYLTDAGIEPEAVPVKIRQRIRPAA